VRPFETVREAAREAADRADSGENDGALVDAARAGDEAARNQLVRRHLAAVYRTTASILRDAQLAEDAAHDAFVNALAGLHRFRGEASFRTWLLRIAVNAAHTVARRQMRRREVDLDAAATVTDGRHDVSDGVVARTERERLGRALERLPPKQRLAVALRVEQGLNYREIAAIAGSTEGAARVNYHLGVKRLRELMA
jgi:RNA polymerase sigma-70 factor, ECF subfamily